MTAAAYLPLPARPPHDPLWMELGGSAGWPAALHADQVVLEPPGCALVLAPAPGAARLLSEPSGSLGGLRPPSHVAVDCEGFVWLLAQASGLLLRFDPCACAFVTIPCTLGRGGGAREIRTPGGIAIAEATIFICDAGAPGRLLVLDRRSFALRAVWAPPPGATAQPWTPRAVAVDGGVVYVADPANGAVHRFARWGGWLGAWTGLGAVAALAADCHRRLFAAVPGAERIVALARSGATAGSFAAPAEVAGAFPAAPFSVTREGIIDLSAICPALCGKGFDADGTLVDLPAAPSPLVATGGTWITAALDSCIARCVWHSVRTDGRAGHGEAIRLAAYTAEVPLSAPDIATLPESAWVPIPAAAPGEEALILAPAGRYLWLRVTLSGDGAGSPRLCGLRIEYPRISLRRYLPAAFGADPEAADFTDRLLAVFDRGFRAIETGIDDRAALFDADSAPAGPGNDVLGWIGAWLGLALERGWPEATRRALVRNAGRLFACRGTPRGLREALWLWLGWGAPPVVPRRPACGPRCAPPARRPERPELILEHWKLRRWLWLGKGRLGADAVVWGESILNRSQLDATARTGATRLDVTRNPLTDPFGVAANRFSVFVPARSVATGAQRGQLDRIVAEHRPADAQAIIVPVHPRMRIGIQASIGFDSVVGCWPAGITLDSARLGRGTVLPSANPGGPTARIGQGSRLQRAPRPLAARQPECRS